MNPLMRLARCRALQALAALWSATLLAACGPNGGGTGTGDSVVQLSDYGARATSSCSAPFAGNLECDVVLVAAIDAASLAGTAAADFASGPPDQARLRLVANQADLQLFCGRARFQGEWGLRSDGDAAYFGLWAIDSTPRRALMRVRPLPGGGLSLQVVDIASGEVLIGPAEVQRTTVPPSGC